MSTAIARMIPVLLVEDHSLVREGLRSFLASYPDVEVVGEATNGEDAIAMLAKLHPAVVVMDVNMPKMDGIACTRRIKSLYPDVAIIGLTVGASRSVASAMQKAGACEVLTKGEDAVDGLYQAIKKAAASGPQVINGAETRNPDTLFSQL